MDGYKRFCDIPPSPEVLAHDWDAPAPPECAHSETTPVVLAVDNYGRRMMGDFCASCRRVTNGERQYEAERE